MTEMVKIRYKKIKKRYKPILRWQTTRLTTKPPTKKLKLATLNQRMPKRLARRQKR